MEDAAGAALRAHSLQAVDGLVGGAQVLAEHLRGHERSLAVRAERADGQGGVDVAVDLALAFRVQQRLLGDLEVVPDDRHAGLLRLQPPDAEVFATEHGLRAQVLEVPHLSALVGDRGGGAQEPSGLLRVRDRDGRGRRDRLDGGGRRGRFGHGALGDLLAAAVLPAQKPASAGSRAGHHRDGRDGGHGHDGHDRSEPAARRLGRAAAAGVVLGGRRAEALGITHGRPPARGSGLLAWGVLEPGFIAIIRKEDGGEISFLVGSGGTGVRSFRKLYQRRNVVSPPDAAVHTFRCRSDPVFDGSKRWLGRIVLIGVAVEPENLSGSVRGPPLSHDRHWSWHAFRVHDQAVLRQVSRPVVFSCRDRLPIRRWQHDRLRRNAPPFRRGPWGVHFFVRVRQERRRRDFRWGYDRRHRKRGLNAGRNRRWIAWIPRLWRRQLAPPGRS
ncbi:MAG: hypothetical protein QG626_896 [Patescibacteria group bacterium]|nr:hypothetical protein [Patescibacteria group bacterium]